MDGRAARATTYTRSSDNAERVAMTKHTACQPCLLTVLLAVGLSAGCPSKPLVGTPDAHSPDSPVVMADGPTLGPDADFVCGNGGMDKGEEWDLGTNDGSYGGCNPDCTLGPYCGDGILQADHEDCDDGVNDGHYRGCNPNCKRAPYCGDGILGRDTEECDDGNDQSGDGCSSICRCENSACGRPGPVCGDMKVDVASGEECDDGNNLNEDGCSDTCRLEPNY